MIRVYNAAGNLIETPAHKGDSKITEQSEMKKPPQGETVTADCEIRLFFWGRWALAIVDHLRSRLAHFKSATDGLAARSWPFTFWIWVACSLSWTVKIFACSLSWAVRVSICFCCFAVEKRSQLFRRTHNEMHSIFVQIVRPSQSMAG